MQSCFVESVRGKGNGGGGMFVGKGSASLQESLEIDPKEEEEEAQPQLVPLAITSRLAKCWQNAGFKATGHEHHTVRTKCSLT